MTNHQPTDPPKPYRITSQVEDAEIVPWLRINAEHSSRASHPSWLMFCVAADAIERLTTERDEARREVSKLMGGSAEQHWYANRRGWDCFKEDGK